MLLLFENLRIRADPADRTDRHPKLHQACSAPSPPPRHVAWDSKLIFWAPKQVSDAILVVSVHTAEVRRFCSTHRLRLGLATRRLGSSGRLPKVPCVRGRGHEDRIRFSVSTSFACSLEEIILPNGAGNLLTQHYDQCCLDIVREIFDR